MLWIDRLSVFGAATVIAISMLVIFAIVPTASTSPTATYPVTVKVTGMDYATKTTTLGFDSDVARAEGNAKFTTNEPSLNGKEMPFELRDVVLYPDGRDIAISQRIMGHLVTGDEGGSILMTFSGRAATGTLESFRTTGDYSHISMSGDYTFIVIPIYEDDHILIYRITGTFEGTITTS